MLGAALTGCAAPAKVPAAPTAAAAVVTPAPAPAAAPAVAPPDPKVLGEWRIEQARSAPLVDKRQARLNFGADGAVSGNASCNTFGGRYTLTGDKLKIGNLAITRKACGDALMEQEDRVLTALERAARATVPPHGFLTIQDADGAVLMRASRFEAAP
jgi:heat shock protein HslJ